MERHKAFIEKIRNINSERITSEEDRMPSISGLYRHWLRTTYFCNLWSNAALGNVYASLPSPQDSGWILNGNNIYSIDWEDQDRQETISPSMHQIIKGCKCKKGCNTSRCGCKKKSTYCGPGCYCSSCSNIPTQISHTTEDNGSSHTTKNTGSSESESSEESSSEESLENEIITDYNFIDIDDDL